MDTQDHRAEGKHQIVVRMPVGLHSRLVEHVRTTDAASVNAEICELVEQHLNRTERRLKAAA